MFHSILFRIYHDVPHPKLNPHGKLTQLYFWARLLTDDEMIEFTHTCLNQINKTGKIEKINAVY